MLDARHMHRASSGVTENHPTMTIVRTTFQVPQLLLYRLKVQAAKDRPTRRSCSARRQRPTSR